MVGWVIMYKTTESDEWMDLFIGSAAGAAGGCALLAYRYFLSRLPCSDTLFFFLSLYQISFQIIVHFGFLDTSLPKSIIFTFQKLTSLKFY
jgi:hypothetical protein